MWSKLDQRMEDHSTSHAAPDPDDEMLEDYGQLEGWRRNPFRFREAEGVVILDPDVFSVFRTSEEVNSALRGLISEGRTPGDSSGRS